MRFLVTAVLGVLLAGCSSADRQAIDECERLIRKVAKNPSSVEIPAPSKIEKVTLGYVIQWEHGSGLRLMNNMGVLLDKTALCLTYNESPETTNTLFIDDELAYSGALEEMKRREFGTQ